MTSDEIKEAIEQNPGGTDLEIALAIGSDEASVAKCRQGMAAKIAEEHEVAAATARGKAADQARRLAELEAAKARKPKAAGKLLPINKGDTPNQRFFYRDPASGQSVELVRLNSSPVTVVFGLAR